MEALEIIAVLLPVIVEVRMIDPGAVPISPLPALAGRAGMLRERPRQPSRQLRARLVDVGRDDRVRLGEPVHLGVMERVVEIVGEAEGAAMGLAVIVIVRRAEGREHRGEMRRRFARQRMLGGGIVGIAAGADLAVHQSCFATHSTAS